jgi:hypothetical protein
LQHKSGGRKPPVVSLHAMATAFGLHTVGGFLSNCDRVCVNVFTEPRRVDACRSLRSPVADSGLIFTAQGRLHTPRRADARRSRGRAFVHRKNRFFAEGRSHCSTRAGGVSPPWSALDMPARNADIQRIVVADTVCNARWANDSHRPFNDSDFPVADAVRKTTAG